MCWMARTPIPGSLNGHFGYSTQLSRFDVTTGTVVFDKVAKTGSVDISIDTKSVNTANATFNEHIQGEDFLDTVKFPTATFKSTKVVSRATSLSLSRVNSRSRV